MEILKCICAIERLLEVSAKTLMVLLISFDNSLRFGALVASNATILIQCGCEPEFMPTIEVNILKTSKT